MSRAPSSPPAPPTVVYVAGTGRSGSTALAQLLEQRLDVVHAGEVRFVWERGVQENHLCQCGADFASCPHWKHTFDLAYAGHPPAAEEVRALSARVDRVRQLARLARSAHSDHGWSDLQRLTDAVAPLYEALAAQHAGRPVLDSSKDPSYLFFLAATGRVDLRVLHLVRDSRAVAHSWTRKKLRPEIHWTEQFMKVRSPRRTASLWLLYNAVIEAWTATHPAAVRVRYEDFVSAPEETADRVAVELGVARRSTPVGSEGHSFSGNPIRFDRGPLRLRLDEEWRTRMRQRDRRLVTAVTAPLLARYGYFGR